MTPSWPALPYEEWKDTYFTLHRWIQVVGKVALKQAPAVNHSWGAALQLTPRGLSTYLLPHGSRSFAMEFDFVEHRLIVQATNDAPRTIPLASQSVADFHRAVTTLLEDMDLPVRISTMPVEIQEEVIRFEEDTVHHTYNPEQANRFWTILTKIAPVFNERRATFVGKASPVHFFWGAHDLAVTRFSGRPAPPREGPAFMREAYTHEVISHGFWPGSAWVLEPAFYAYAVPEPPGLKEATVQPAAAYYHADFGEFILPYESVRTSPDPEAAIRAFIDSTYDQAATLAHWDRASLERSGMPA